MKSKIKKLVRKISLSDISMYLIIVVGISVVSDICGNFFVTTVTNFSLFALLGLVVSTITWIALLWLVLDIIKSYIAFEKFTTIASNLENNQLIIVDNKGDMKISKIKSTSKE